VGPVPSQGKGGRLKRSRSGTDAGSPRPGLPSHVAMARFRSQTGTDATHIPYRGGGAMVAVLAGEVQMCMETPATLAPPTWRARCGASRLGFRAPDALLKGSGGSSEAHEVMGDDAQNESTPLRVVVSRHEGRVTVSRVEWFAMAWRPGRTVALRMASSSRMVVAPLARACRCGRGTPDSAADSLAPAAPGLPPATSLAGLRTAGN